MTCVKKKNNNKKATTHTQRKKENDIIREDISCVELSQALLPLRPPEFRVGVGEMEGEREGGQQRTVYRYCVALWWIYVWQKVFRTCSCKSALDGNRFVERLDHVLLADSFSGISVPWPYSASRAGWESGWGGGRNWRMRAFLISLDSLGKAFLVDILWRCP